MKLDGVREQSVCAQDCFRPSKNKTVWFFAVFQNKTFLERGASCETLVLMIRGGYMDRSATDRTLHLCQAPLDVSSAFLGQVFRAFEEGNNTNMV